MNGVQVQSDIARKHFIGWYAIHWAHVMGWIQLYRRTLETRQSSFGVQLQNRPHVHSFGGIAPAQSLADSITEENKLKQAVEDTHRILAQASSVFPFMMFPDTITVDRQKLTIVYRKFFGSHQTVSVPLDNIKNIQADFGPLFGSLTVTSDHFINNTQSITGLTHSDAKSIQLLVQGITSALSEGIDLSKIETEPLKEHLRKLGEGHVD